MHDELTKGACHCSIEEASQDSETEEDESQLKHKLQSNLTFVLLG